MSQGFRLTVLGSGTGIPAPDRGPAGLLVQVAGESWLLDAGPGSLQRLSPLGVTYQTLDRVLLTHYHVDHSLDLAAILFAMHIPGPAARTKPLVVYGPPGLRRLHEALRAAYPGMLDANTYPLTIEELTAGTRMLGDIELAVHAMQHSATAFGYRLTWRGKTIAYSGDTDVCPGVVALGRDADLLVLECSTPDEQHVRGHLTPTACGRIAADARCRKLILTHFYPIFRGYDILARVRAAFAGPVELARDGQSFLL